jgi:hypothetical protein
MRKCIVHFGFHKTGTTSIQQAIFSQLRSRDAACVHLGSPFIDRDIIAAFASEPWQLAPDLGPEDAVRRRSIRESLREAIAGLPYSRLLISAEDLSRFDEAALEDFVEFLQDQGLSIEAVAYVRDHARWCESIFQQSLKYGTWRMSLFPLGMGVYRRAVAAFDRLLGREHVQLWKYDRERFPSGCVVRDFFARLRLGECRDAPADLNEGLSLDAARLLRAFHASRLRPVTDRTSFERNITLASYVAGLEGAPVRFDPALVAERMQSEAGDLDWIEARLGESIRQTAAEPPTGEVIRSEADLDRFSVQSLEWLERESGVRVSPGGDTHETARQVAQAMSVLQDRICAVRQPFVFDRHPRGSLPKTIWTFWLQGMERAPEVVKRCVASWQEMNPGWDVRVLDGSTAEPYLARATVPARRLAALPPEKRANILRMRLLTEEGGVWTDASTLCLRPLDHWLPECMAGGFFFFRDAAPFLMAENWFLAAERRSRLAELWRDEHERFWASRDYLHHSSYPGQSTPGLPFLQRELLRRLHSVFDRSQRTTELWFHPLVRLLLRTYPYCVMHYLFSRGYRRNREWRELADRVPYRDAKPVLMHYIGAGQEKSLEELMAAGREQGLPLLKLNRRHPPR